MNNVDKWFAPLAHVLVVTATAGIGLYVGSQVSIGKFPWWPYPAFILLVIGIFSLYGLLSKKED